jgi:hypothetical protein
MSSGIMLAHQSNTLKSLGHQSSCEKSYNQEYTSVSTRSLQSPKPFIGTIGLRSLQHLTKTRQVTYTVALDLQSGKKLDLSCLSSIHNSNQPFESQNPTLSLSGEFEDFANVFNKTSADKFPAHTEYNCTIPLGTRYEASLQYHVSC